MLGLMRNRVPVFPYRKKAANAGSAVAVPYNLVDDGLEPLDISALRWRYDDLTNAKVLQDWTTIDAPEARGVLTIPASLNAMSFHRDYQLNQITFESTDTAGNKRQTLAYVELGAVYHAPT